LILVTVGTHHEGFNRLVEAADQLAAAIDERVVIQRGSSTSVPQHAEQFQFAPGAEMAQLTQDARVIITHAASGSSLLGLQHGKPLVLVPRLRRYHEHMDDHQQELARGLSERGLVVVVDEPTADSLREALDRATKLSPTVAGPGQLIANVRAQLDRWQTHTRKNI
jgi:beta-1,4-N-acetylglucosaminyltransferase